MCWVSACCLGAIAAGGCLEGVWWTNMWGAQLYMQMLRDVVEEIKQQREIDVVADIARSPSYGHR